MFYLADSHLRGRDAMKNQQQIIITINTETMISVREGINPTLYNDVIDRDRYHLALTVEHVMRTNRYK